MKRQWLTKNEELFGELMYLTVVQMELFIWHFSLTQLGMPFWFLGVFVISALPPFFSVCCRVLGNVSVWG
jgi:hypothetical protein